jgi:hypothetical protein
MRKQLYICGDSFCGSDPTGSGSWVNLLQKQHADLDIINLSSPAASNYLIYLQVKQAIESAADYVIYHATSSIRQEFVINTDSTYRDTVSRYWHMQHSDVKKPMVCVSWPNPQNTAAGLLSDLQTKELQNFFNKYIDLTSLIEKNYVFIQHSLNLLDRSKVSNWIWSQGGFEHAGFGNVIPWDFDTYRPRESIVNLWDYYDPKKKKPYYHVDDPEVIETVCKHYTKMLQLNNV